LTTFFLRTSKFPNKKGTFDVNLLFTATLACTKMALFITKKGHFWSNLRAGSPGLRAARRKEGLHGTIGFLGSDVRIETQASDWLTLVDKITKNSKCKQQHFEL
jgi:hypothetical protein